MNTSISRCLISDFKPFEIIKDKIYKLRWGKQTELERVYVINEETKRPEYTGETKETDWCTYESGVYRGVLTPYLLDQAMKGVKRSMSIEEYNEILSYMNIEDPVPYLVNKLIKVINEYDTSTEVNSFYVNDIQMWLDKATRTGLLLRFQSDKAQEKTDTVLWYNGQQFPLKVDDAIMMLYDIESYASACYDKTQEHLANVSSLTTKEDILVYDYKIGYPNKLRF